MGGRPRARRRAGAAERHHAQRTPARPSDQLLQLRDHRRRRQRHGPRTPTSRTTSASTSPASSPTACCRTTPTSTTLVLTTNQEFYYPGVVTTQIDLYTPAFNPVSKTVTNLSGNSPARAGDTLEYQLSFTNTGHRLRRQRGRHATCCRPNVDVRARPACVVTASPGGVNNGAKTDAAGDDIGEYVAGSRTVRAARRHGATATAGGTLAPNATVTFRFRVTLDRASSGTTVTNGVDAGVPGPHDRPGLHVRRQRRGHPGRRARRHRGHQGVRADVAGRRPHGPVPADGHQQRPERGRRRDARRTRCPPALTFVAASAPAGTSCAATGQVVDVHRRHARQRRVGRRSRSPATIASGHRGRHRGQHGARSRRRRPTTSPRTTRATATTQITSVGRPRRRQDGAARRRAPPAANVTYTVDRDQRRTVDGDDGAA